MTPAGDAAVRVTGPAPSRAARLWRRTWIGALMILALAGVAALTSRSGSSLPLIGTACVLSLRAAVEMDRMAAQPRGVLLSALSATTLACVGLALRGGGEGSGRPELLAAYGLALALAVVAWLLCRAPGARSLRIAALSCAWIVPPLGCIPLLWESYGLKALIALVLLSKVGDIAGYYVGSAIGRTHPFPRISPGKTTAGCVGSLIAGTLAGGGVVALGWLQPLWGGVALGCVAGAGLNLAAQAGDLLESAVKRRCGVKDSGALFGPAGGVLDLVDSLLLTVPLALLCWPLLFSGV